MLKRCGKIRVWHFAHDYWYKKEVNKECSYESYLHAFAKLKLKQWFEESEKIALHYQQSMVCKYSTDCIWMESSDECSRREKKIVDLKKYLTVCKLEETVYVDDDRFRADLLWCNPNNSKNDILIEIKVTHECTQKKKESNKRIIEFEIHSEEDVENIVANDIQESDTVRFYGFNPKDIIDKDIQARYSLSKFTYYQSGKAYLTSCNCKNYGNRRKSALLEITYKNSVYASSALSERQGSSKVFSKRCFYNWGMALARNKGYNVRNCCLCIHRHYDYGEKQYICDLKPDELIETSYAISCSNYMLDEGFYKKNLKEFTVFSQNNLVDVWTKT